jgi:citrate synthase
MPTAPTCVKVEREGQEFIRVPKGLANVIVDQTTISGVDPRGQNTLYRGYLISDIGRNASFEEAAYLILYGKLPCDEELKEFTRKLNSERWIPTKLLDALKMVPPTHPMYYGAFGVLLLGMYDPNPDDMSRDALYDRAIRIIAKLPVIFANGWYLSRHGYTVEPDRSLRHAQDVLRMLLGGHTMPGSLESRVFESSLILYMDHGFNASTFTNRVIASTLSDMYSAVAGAIGALKGPLHGGANQKALEMMLEIGEPEKARDYVVEKLRRRQKVMGFGHRVYKIHDPRTDVLREWLVKLAEYYPEAKKFLGIINELEKAMWELKRIPSNVDLYTGAVYHVLGIPKELFTPIFAIARVVGWTAHYIEQVTNNKIIRPKEEYVGPVGLKYVPMEERSKR